MSALERTPFPSPHDRDVLLDASIDRMYMFRRNALTRAGIDLGDRHSNLLLITALLLRVGLDDPRKNSIVIGSQELDREIASRKLLAMCAEINQTISSAVAIVVGSEIIEDDGKLYFYPNASRWN